MKKDTLTLLVFATAAIALLLLATTSPLLPLSNFLLQPVQAQTELTFQTPKPATGSDPRGDSISLTFYAQGTPSTSNPSQVDITRGNFNYTVLGYSYPGRITSVSFTNNTSGGSISFVTSVGVAPFTVTSKCSTSDNNIIGLSARDNPSPYSLKGPVECTSSSSSSSSQGGGNATSSSMTGTTTQQDSDSDGIPDSSDRCTHNSNPRCFKEGGDTSGTTTTPEQQPSSTSPSSSSSSGNQTR